MQKALLHFGIIAFCFFSLWFGLSHIDFVRLFNIERVTHENERKIGDFILESMQSGSKELDSDSAQAMVGRIKERICTANAISDTTIIIHILDKKDVNAFALPGGHLVVNAGLIRYCNTPEELAGVLAHEIAHIQQNHVMKKLAKEVGLSMLTTLAGGEAGGREIARETLKLLSSTAFDREQEREADRLAVHLLAEANIDPEQMANLLFRLSQETKNISTEFEWLNTHPDSRNRSAQILKLKKKENIVAKPLLQKDEWIALKSELEMTE
jgi:beta-barrel assembly-enhancing protease